MHLRGVSGNEPATGEWKLYETKLEMYGMEMERMDIVHIVPVDPGIRIRRSITTHRIPPNLSPYDGYLFLWLDG